MGYISSQFQLYTYIYIYIFERRLLFAYMESSIRAYPGLSKTSYLACKTREEHPENEIGKNFTGLENEVGTPRQLRYVTNMVRSSYIYIYICIYIYISTSNTFSYMYYIYIYIYVGQKQITIRGMHIQVSFRVSGLYGGVSKPIIINFSGVNIHKSQLFWYSPGVQGFDQ